MALPRALPVQSLFSLLESCKGLENLMNVHSRIILSGLSDEIYLGTKLVNLYSAFGCLDYARRVFFKLSCKNVYLYNAVIRGHSRAGLREETLAFYRQLGWNINVFPDRFTFPFALKACSAQKMLLQGMEIHGHVFRLGFQADVAVAVALIDMYSRCRRLEDACHVFDEMPLKDTAAWNVIMKGFLKNGGFEQGLEIFRKMQKIGNSASPVSVVTLLPVCWELGLLSQGEEIHGYVIRNGVEIDASVGSAILSMYANCGCMEASRRVFDKLPKGEPAFWNSMISGFTQNELFPEALQLFAKMVSAQVEIDQVSILSVLQCLGNVAQVQRMHGFIFRRMFEASAAIQNSLVALYSRFGTPETAKLVFDRILLKDVFSWTAIIAGHVQNEKFKEALQLFCSMLSTDCVPDSVTLVNVISACTGMEEAQLIHSWIQKNGFGSEISVMNALITIYANVGHINLSCRVFHKMAVKDVGTWTAMIAGYAKNDHFQETLDMFCEVQQLGAMPDFHCLANVTSACANLGDLRNGQVMHSLSVKLGFHLFLSVGTALLNMYARCGDLGMAVAIFERMPKRDVVCWTAMIGAYGMHGQGKQALEVFSQMLQSKVLPNSATFVSVLSACSHAGLVYEGIHYFNCMSQKFGIEPDSRHYACIVGLLGRAGLVGDAVNFVKKVPTKPDANIWGSLLGACKIHGKNEVAEHVASCSLDMNPDNPRYSLLLSNSYDACGI